MKTLKLQMIGTSPILLACDRLADPLDPLTIAHKVLTSNKKKTEDTHLAIARSQWNGSLYHDPEIGVYLPTQNIRATLVGGAQLSKLGMHCKRATSFLEEKVPLDYGKKLTPDQLWDSNYTDRRSVVIAKRRVMCYRPKFTDWKVDFDIIYDETVLDSDQIIQSFENAGKFIGIGGFRPEKGGTFGRFVIQKTK